MTEERVHKRYSPSKTKRFFKCEGSVALLARVPVRSSSIYAIEGTKAHDVLETGLRLKLRKAKDAHEESVYFAEDLDDVTNEFYLSIQIAMDYVYAILDEHPDAVMHLETFVDPPLPAAPGEAGGYCDIAIFIPSLCLLYIIDYKHGAGIAEDIEGNTQVRQYAAGFLYEEGASEDLRRDVDSVVLAIVQPRAFHKDGIIREETITPYELWEYLEDLNDKVEACERPDAPLTPGEDQCRFCDAKTLCPAREAQALQVASSAFSQIGDVRSSALPDPVGMDVKRLGLIRFHAKTLRKWLDDVDAHCQELARTGHHVPGAKLVETQARREYYGSERQVARKLAAMIGDGDAEAAMDAYDALMDSYPVLERIFKQSVIPITTAEKLVVEAYKARVGRGRKRKASEHAKQAFAFLTLKKSSGSLTLVDEDDKRPEVNRARTAFSGVQNLLPPPTT